MFNNDFGFCGKCSQHFPNHLKNHILSCDGIRKNYPPLRKVENGIESGSIEDFFQQTGRYPTKEDINDYNL